jgi:pantothenate kinase
VNEIIFPSEVTVTEQVVDCTQMSDDKRAFVIDFTRTILSEFKASGLSRVCYGIAGPSGSGKSFLSVLAREVGKQIDPTIDIVPISIDAFHFPNNYLESVEKDGVNLKSVKGRYDTYDVGDLLNHLERYKREGSGSIFFPEYSRKIHEPMPNIIKVEERPTILLLEGLWLLYDKAGWSKIEEILDKKFYIDDDAALSRERTLLRHKLGGRTDASAAKHYEESDLKNRELVMATRERADSMLTWPE